VGDMNERFLIRYPNVVVLDSRQFRTHDTGLTVSGRGDGARTGTLSETEI